MTQIRRRGRPAPASGRSDRLASSAGRQVPPEPGRRPGEPSVPGDLVLRRYRLERIIGRGAMSTVWLGRDERLDRPVAVKVLDERALPDGAARARLEREARSVARLSHPNVVGVHDVAVGPERAAIVLEYVPGRSLLERLREGPLPMTDALRIGADVASGLAAAHALGLVHRDVKPANILLGDDGRARLADFGIATALGEAADADEDGVVGTLRYMAPERLEGAPAGAAADVWSLGVVLFQMLTGRTPYEGATPAELRAAQRARPGPLAVLPADLPPGVGAPVGRALDPGSTTRPPAAELAGGLRALESEALQPPDLAPSGGSVGDLPTQTDLVHVPARPARPSAWAVSPVAAAVTGLVAIAALAIGVAVMTGPLAPDAAPPAALASPSPTSSPQIMPSPTSPAAAATAPAPAAHGHVGGTGKGRGKGH